MRTGKRWVLLGAALALGGAGRAAWAMAGEHGKGDPKHPISCSSWPAGVTVLANRTDRVSGRWINANDSFYYVDDTKGLNDFLREYAKVRGASLALYSGKDSLLLVNPDCNWEMNVCGWGEGQASASAGVRVGGSISLQAMHVPLEVSVSVTDTADKALKAFANAHKARQDKAASRIPNSLTPSP